MGLAKSTKFPWLMSNVVDKLTNQPLGEGLVKHIITWEGRKVRNYVIVSACTYLRTYMVSLHTVIIYIRTYLQIGLIGLVEYEWLATLSTISPEDVDYTDFVDCAQLLVPQLTAEVLCNLLPW